MTQAAALKRRETPKGRPGRSGLRADPMWLGAIPTRCSAKTRPEWEITARNGLFIESLFPPWSVPGSFHFRDEFRERKEVMEMSLDDYPSPRQIWLLSTRTRFHNRPEPDTFLICR